MQYYLEVTLINSSEIKTYELWSKLYTQLHLALVNIKGLNNKVNIGFSFPEYRCNLKKRVGFLGDKLRIFAQSEECLQQLNIKQWLDRLIDYIHISTIKLVPQDKVTGHVSFFRKHVKSNAERLARRCVKKRKDISFDEAVKLYQHVVIATDLPFVQMKSLSKDERFKLFIEKNIREKSDEHRFNTYGLSAESTVPEF